MKTALLLFLLAAAPLATADDTRIPLSPLTTPGDADSTFRITAPGSYYLVEELAGEAGKAGIEITAPNVTIDLQGFRLAGTQSALDGISAQPPFAQKITVTNGFVTGWGGVGINLSGATFSRVTDVTAFQNGSHGILIGGFASIERCTAQVNGNGGIRTGPDSLITNCRAQANDLDGIRADRGSIVRECIAESNDSSGIAIDNDGSVLACIARNNIDGIVTGEDGLVEDCVVTLNERDGVNMVSGTLRGCTIAKNERHGARIERRVLVTGNRFRANVADGLRIENGDARVEDNHVSEHTAGDGIHCGGTGNFVVKNTLFRNQRALFVLASGNFAGPLVSVNAVFGKDDPWANFTGN